MLLVTHSYGSCPGGAAAKGCSKSERVPLCKTGGIIGLVFIAGVLIDDGHCLLDGLGGNWDTWHILNVSFCSSRVKPKSGRLLFHAFAFCCMRGLHVPLCEST